MNHQTRVYESIFEMLPSEENPSPLVRIGKMNPNPAFELYAKLEWLNPFGSIKDRAASEMIRDLEERGELKRGETRAAGRGIVEPTSGNTGISLAAMASAKGYAMRAIVPQKVPLEKRVLLRIAGGGCGCHQRSDVPEPGDGRRVDRHCEVVCEGAEGPLRDAESV